MQDAGIDLIPSNDFSLYDQVLDTIALVGAVPERYGWDGGPGRPRHLLRDGPRPPGRRRRRDRDGDDQVVRHELPLHRPRARPRTSVLAVVAPSRSTSTPRRGGARDRHHAGADRARSASCCSARPADGRPSASTALDLLEPLVEVYGEVIEKLGEQGATWVQLDEPCLSRTAPSASSTRCGSPTRSSARSTSAPRILVKTYFDHVGEAYGVLRELPIDGIGLDFTGRAETSQRTSTCTAADECGVPGRGRLDDKWLFAGFVDGRNVWINDLEHCLDALEGLRELAPSSWWSRRAALCCTRRSTCDAEPAGDADLDDEMRSWMAFAVQKVGEVATLAKGLADGRDAIADELDANDRARDSRRDSHRTRTPEVRARVEALTDADARRARVSAERKRGPAGALRLADVPDDDDRLVSADRRDPPARARSCGRARSTRPHLRGADARRDRAGDRLPGGDRPRRAGARRARAQRHGPVLRRADARLRLHPERLGAVLRLALRAPADHLRRRQPARADDGRVDHTTRSR